jgi:hypothetical protein
MKSNVLALADIPVPATPLPVCPRCSKAFDSVNIHPATGVVLFSCPLCHCFLGIQAVTPAPVVVPKVDWLDL